MKFRLSSEWVKKITSGDAEDIPACPGCGVMAGPHFPGCPELEKSKTTALRAIKDYFAPIGRAWRFIRQLTRNAAHRRNSRP